MPPPAPLDRRARLVRWTERLLKTDLRYLTTGTFWSVIGQAASSLIALGLSVAMAHYVPKEAYGTYKYVIAVIAVLSTFSLTGINSAVMQSVARGASGAVAEGFRAVLRWSFAVFLGAFALGGYYLVVGNTTLGFGILLAGCAAPFLTAYNTYQALFSGMRDFARLTWYGGFVTSMVPALALIATALVAPRPVPLLAAYFLGNVAAAAYAYYRGLARYEDGGVRDPEMLRYGKHLSAIGILSGIAGNIDQLLLFHFGGAIDLAVYSFATGIVNQAKGPIKALDTMMQVRFAARSEDDIRSGLRNKYLWLLIGTAIMTALYIAFAPLVFHLLFPAYLEAVPYSQVYALSLVSFALLPASSYLTAKKLVRAQYISTVAGSLVQIAALVVGVVWWGLWGLIVARVITRFVLYALPPLFTGSATDSA